jgi:hypothetical protein
MEPLSVVFSVKFKADSNLLELLALPLLPSALKSRMTSTPFFFGKSSV